jgi:hypothetical protein
MNLLECTKVNTFFEFTKLNEKIFKKKLFVFVNDPNCGCVIILTLDFNPPDSRGVEAKLV